MTNKLKERVEKKLLNRKIDPANKNTRFDLCFQRLMKHEGGKSDHPDDKGGKTNYGISQPIFKAMKKDGLTKVDDVYKISLREAYSAYYKYFWKQYKCDEQNIGIDYFRFDCFVQHSPKDAELIFEKSQTIQELRIFRIELYNKIVERNPKQKVFLKGWLNRVEEVFARSYSDMRANPDGNTDPRIVPVEPNQVYVKEG